MKRTALIAMFCLISAAPALAHAGHGWESGFIHPFTGWDHLAAMLAVGAWGAVLGGRAIWAVPASFVTMMMVGFLLAFAGLSLPFVEFTILASVLVLAGLVLTGARLPLAASMALVSVFALAHGFAHGAEMPSTSGAVVYAAGLVAASLLLHGLGAITTVLCRRGAHRHN